MLYLTQNHDKGGTSMPDYQKLYHIMFNAVTDAERKLEAAAIILRSAQQECESIYIEEESEPTHDDVQS